MTDQCKHCTVRGDIKNCLQTQCFHHENWIAEQHRERLTAVRDALQLAIGYLDLEDAHQKHAYNIAAEALVKTA
jgi:hypothetical protein